MSLSNDKALKSVAEAVSKIMEAEKKAKMDYDKDGKVESPKDEVWGSRLRAAKMAGKLKEEDTYQKDRYAVKSGKAVKDNPSHMGSANYKDQEHHVWASSSEEALNKKMKKEEVKQIDEEHLVHVYDGSKYGDKPHKDDVKHIMAGVKKHNGENYGGSDKGAFFKFKSHEDANAFRRHVDSCPKRTCYAHLTEDVEQLDEISKKLASSYVTKAIADKSKDRTKGLRKATSRAYKDNFYGKTNEETEQLDEKMISLRHKSTGKELKVPVSSVGSYKTGGYVPVSPGSVKEESELDEAFPSVEDAKKRMDANKSKFEKTKTNTGTVYKRKMEDEKKEVKESLSFTEMLELYNEHGLKVLAPIESGEIEVEGNTIEVIDADKINGYVETVVEEADQEEYNKTLEANKKKAAGTSKQPDLAKGDVQAVKNEEVESMDEKLQLFHSTGPGAQMKRFNKDSPDPSAAGHRKATADAARTARASGQLKTSQKHTLSYGSSNEVGTKKGGTILATKINEEVEQLDELSTKTLTSYVSKRRAQGVNPAKAKDVNKAITKTMSKQTATWQKEEVEKLDERHLTSGETKKKEEYAKSMKKGLSGFRQRYGDRAKEVMYATATKMAKKD